MPFSFDEIPMKTKIISVLVIFLLILPGIVMPNLKRAEPEVAGINNTNESESESKSDTNIFKFPEVKLPDANLQAFAPTLPNFNQNNNQPQTVLIANQASAPTLVVNVNNNVDDIRQRILDQQNPTIAQIQTGKVAWESGLGDSVLSDKFPVGSKVNIKVGDKNQIFTITDNRILPVNTIMIISKEKFTTTFADPEKTKEVDATGEKV
jgi:hypothetical protein